MSGTLHWKKEGGNTPTLKRLNETIRDYEKKHQTQIRINSEESSAVE